MRRFEYKDEKSHKFWEVEVQGSVVSVRYGKIGAKGQSKDKEHESAESAELAAEKLIKQKTKKGYAEVPRDAVSPAVADGPAALDAWHTPNAHEEIVRYLKSAGEEELCTSVSAFVDMWLRAHNEDPSVLWELMRSPLRTILMLLARSGRTLPKKLDDYLWSIFEPHPNSYIALALAPEIPRSLWMRLLPAKDHKVRILLASNTGMAEDVLMALCELEEFLTSYIVRNENASDQVLARLLENETARAYVGGHRNASAETLEKLAAQPRNEGVARALAGNPNTPLAILSELAASEDRHTLVQLAQNPALPAEIFELLAQKEVGELAQNPSAPAALLSSLASEEQHPNFLRILVANPSLPEEHRSPFLSHKNDKVRQAAASATTSRFEELAKSEDESIRTGLAQNAGPSAALLSALADDPVHWVAMRVSENPNANAATLAKLASHENQTIRQKVAFHRSTARETLIELLADKDSEVCEMAMRNPGTPLEAREAAVRKKGKRVLGSVQKGKGKPGAVAERAFVPSEALALLADKAPAEVAKHPMTLFEDLVGAVPPKPDASVEKTGKQELDTHVYLAQPNDGRMPSLAMVQSPAEKNHSGDRIGGLPSPWADDCDWPDCGICLKPMSFVIQLVGQAAGGTVNLGPHHALQAFACEGDCLGQKGSAEVFLRGAALGEGEVPVPSPFPGKVATAQAIGFEEKDDDARLIDDPYLDDQEAWDAAQYEKIGGSVVFGNEPWGAECSHCGEVMPLWGNFYAMEAECFFRACPHMHEIVMITQL